jgi:putative phage-type endonuclease
MKAFEIIPLQQNTKEWHKFRLGGIGASEASSVLAIDPWRTPCQLWEQKLGLREGAKENDAMRRGKALEPEALSKFMEIIQIPVAPQVCKSTRWSHMFASMDGMSEDGKTAVEIKCPGLHTHMITVNGKVPDYYIPQLNHQMQVLHLDKIHYMSYCPEYEDAPIVILTHCRDESADDLVAKEAIFWQNVKTFTPPALTDRDYTKQYDEQFEHWVKEYKRRDELIKALQNEKEGFRALMLARAKDNCIEGAGVRITRYAVKGRVDMDRVKEELLSGVDLEPYRKESTIQWRIS